MRRAIHNFVVLTSLALLLAGCGKTTAPEASKSNAGETQATARNEGEDKAAGKAQEGVTLTPEQLEKLGVTIEPVQATEYREETPGYAVVLEHQAIAQAVAELQTAEAAARFSRSSVERARQLKNTPAAVSTDLEQTAEQKASVDAVAVALSTEKLTTLWGMKPPWKDDVHDPRVQSLARGSLQLVRATFPLGSLPQIPDELRGGRVGTSRSDAVSTMRPVWQAPADATIPGRSFFALLPGGALSEGERLQVWAPTGQPTPGTLIPSSAVVLNAGKYWCYVQKAPGTFGRVELDTTRAMSGGLFVTEGVKPGDRIVVTAASELLAKETGSSEEPD